MMTLLANILIALVAVLHVYFLVLEMFLWDTPFGRKAFNLTAEFSSCSKVLAVNQGLYNCFLAAVLSWGICMGVSVYPIKLFFLSCVIVAGVYGAATVSKKIFFVQAVPAIIAILLVLVTHSA